MPARRYGRTKIEDSSGAVVNPAKSEHTQALVDDTIKGLLRSIGDAGANPSNQTGYTLLKSAYNAQYYANYAQQYLLNISGSSSFSLLTNTPLSANASFTSISEDRSSYNHKTVVAHAFADQPGTLYIEQSPDGTNWDIVESISVPANTGTALVTTVKSRSVRIRYVNGATAQTVFRLAKRYLFC
jgi:hypothetical protein